MKADANDLSQTLDDKSADEMSEAEIDDNLKGTLPASDPPAWALGSITFERKGSLASSVEIMLDGTGVADVRHLTHTVTEVQRIVPKAGADGREDALEIEAGDGTRTLLAFETLPAIPETT